MPQQDHRRRGPEEVYVLPSRRPDGAAGRASSLRRVPAVADVHRPPWETADLGLMLRVLAPDQLLQGPAQQHRLHHLLDGRPIPNS